MAEGKTLVNWLFCFCSAGFCLFLLCHAVLSGNPGSHGRGSAANTANDRLFTEVERQINENAVFADPGTTFEELVRYGIGPYLRKMDPYSDYLTRDEYSRFKESRGNHFVGIGMDIEKAPDGGVICFPFPASPAERAGVMSGDRLERIDGVTVQGKSLFAVAAMSRGKEGTRVTLTIVDQNGRQRELTAKRFRLNWKSVTNQSDGDFRLIKVNAFTSDTGKELEQALRESPVDVPVIIDIRGNRGGDLIAAIDSARLFLRKDMTIVAIRRRWKVSSFKTIGNGPHVGTRLYLWQDEKTASAAEVFVAALTVNGRALSIGKRTFGKGSRQDVIPLSDGSALVLTTGYLETPSGAVFNGIGLEPSHPVNLNNPGTADYRNRTKELFRCRVPGQQ